MLGLGSLTLAGKVITDDGLRTIGFRRIDGLADVENAASQKLLTTAGFQKEGILRNKVTRDDGRQIDMALFATTDTTWTPLEH